jgi:hypothetical protein
VPQADSKTITPKTPLPQALPPATRAKVEAAIEAHMQARDALVAFLDQADGDTDLEPSLGDHMPWIPLAMIDCEADEHDGREPSDDLEPSLGARPCVGLLNGDQNVGFSQTDWANSGTDDREGI